MNHIVPLDLQHEVKDYHVIYRHLQVGATNTLISVFIFFFQNRFHISHYTLIFTSALFAVFISLCNKFFATSIKATNPPLVVRARPRKVSS